MPFRTIFDSQFNSLPDGWTTVNGGVIDPAGVYHWTLSSTGETLRRNESFLFSKKVEIEFRWKTEAVVNQFQTVFSVVDNIGKEVRLIFGPDIQVKHNGLLKFIPSFAGTFITVKIITDGLVSRLFVNGGEQGSPQNHLDNLPSAGSLSLAENSTEKEGRMEFWKMLDLAEFEVNESNAPSDLQQKEIGVNAKETKAVADSFSPNFIGVLNPQEIACFVESMQAGTAGQIQLEETARPQDVVVAQRFILESAIAFVTDKSTIVVREVF